VTRNIYLAIFLLVFAGLGPLPLPAQSTFSRGEELFMQNNPEAALPALEAALAEDPANLKTYQYLGIIYLQLERPEDAVAVYLKALPRSGPEAPRINFNLGNTYFTMGDYERAIRYYSDTLDANPAYASARLNRANARMRLGAMPEAIEDYRFYLTLEPRSPKRAQIENLIAFVAEEAAIAEQRRITEAEQARAEAERVRLEEERERVASEERARVEAERVQQEEERRRRLLEEVSASLQADAGETRGLSAGSERPQDYDGEFELE
jgi:tetratricopeptide (TPR) repeat protein